MKWKIPPKIKIYEALGSIADNRVEISDNEIKVFSSSRNKFYEVNYDKAQNAIIANDNGSYWQGYLGYPSIAYLMKIGELPFDQEYANALKNIAWKDINVKNKNNFEKTISEIHETLQEQNINIEIFKNFINKVEKSIIAKKLNILGKKRFPPKAY